MPAVAVVEVELLHLRVVLHTEQVELVVEAEDKDPIMLVQEEQLTLVVELVVECLVQLQDLFQLQDKDLMEEVEL